MDPRYMPASLYTEGALLEGYRPDDVLGVTGTFDCRMYREYTLAGGSVSKSLDDGLNYASHDAHIADHLRTWVDSEDPRMVGVMGGHSLSRAHPAYKEVSVLARSLADAGYTVVTGGGPGAMEAAHLGASTSGEDDGVLRRALAYLADNEHHPELPTLTPMFTDDGDIVEGTAAAAQQWFAPAYHVRHELLPDRLHPSLAVPTWLYGNEPMMPFATAYAKYFNNSIREEALVTRALAGMVYAQGGGGTIREIFQDMEENYCAEGPKNFTPMVFFDPGRYWQTSGSTGINLYSFVPEVVRYAHRRKDVAPFLAKVRFTTDTAEILELLASHSSAAQRSMRLMLAGRGFLEVPRDRG